MKKRLIKMTEKEDQLRLKMQHETDVQISIGHSGI